jgi:hypothetical protein
VVGTLVKGPSKKTKNKTRNKKIIQAKSDRPTPLLFVFAGYARRLWAWHPTWAPEAGCGISVCELVPSDGPLTSMSWCLFGFFVYKQRQFVFFRKIN